MKVLAIGNSFSQDATHYLHQIAASDNVMLKVGNLYIGGCSLERHWNNILNDAKEYLYEENGKEKYPAISVREALEAGEWDFIVTQQASHDSGIFETYFPYLENIAAYVKEITPKSEFLLHETWAYESDSQHGEFYRYKFNQNLMYQKLSEAYRKAAERIGARLIPCGKAVQGLRAKEPFLYGHGGMSLCRDGFHMNITYGRYLLSAVWYRFLTGNSISRNTYIPRTDLAPNAVFDEKVLNVIKKYIDETI